MFGVCSTQTLVEIYNNPTTYNELNLRNCTKNRLKKGNSIDKALALSPDDSLKAVPTLGQQPGLSQVTGT